MGDAITEIAGIDIPSTNPVFLAVVGVHVLLGLACVVTGAIAMLSQKRPGRHPLNGTIYFWCLAGLAFTAASLAAVRWAEDYHLFILGALSFASAYFGRRARRERWRRWVRLHIAGLARRTSCCSLRSTWTTARACRSGKNFRWWRIGFCRQRSGFP